MIASVSDMTKLAEVTPDGGDLISSLTDRLTSSFRAQADQPPSNTGVVAPSSSSNVDLNVNVEAINTALGAAATTTIQQNKTTVNGTQGVQSTVKATVAQVGEAKKAFAGIEKSQQQGGQGPSASGGGSVVGNVATDLGKGMIAASVATMVAGPLAGAAIGKVMTATTVMQTASSTMQAASNSGQQAAGMGGGTSFKSHARTRAEQRQQARQEEGYGTTQPTQDVMNLAKGGQFISPTEALPDTLKFGGRSLEEARGAVDKLEQNVEQSEAALHVRGEKGVAGAENVRDAAMASRDVGAEDLRKPVGTTNTVALGNVV